MTENEFNKNAVRRMVMNLAHKRRRTPKNRQRQLWCMVADATSHGSGYSRAICYLSGFDPDTGEEIECKQWEELRIA